MLINLSPIGHWDWPDKKLKEACKQFECVVSIPVPRVPSRLDGTETFQYIANGWFNHEYISAFRAIKARSPADERYYYLVEGPDTGVVYILVGLLQQMGQQVFYSVRNGRTFKFRQYAKMVEG